MIRNLRFLKFPKFRPKFSVNNSVLYRQYSRLFTGEELCDVRGYYVLLPELPPNGDYTSETNEVLNHTAVPSTFNIPQKKFRDAFSVLSVDFETQVWDVDQALKDKTYPIRENLLKDLDTVQIEYAISILKIVHILHNIPNYDRLIRRIDTTINTKYMSRPIYHLLKELLADNPKDSKLKHHVLMGQLNGMELAPEGEEIIKFFNKSLYEHRSKWAENITIANANFRHLVVDEKHLGEMSISEMTAIAKDKTNPRRGPWTVTLDRQIYKSFLENCPIPALRWNIWEAYHQRCIDHQDVSKRNGVAIEDIRFERLKFAKTLGYRNHADFRLENSMAANPQNVKSLIATLLLKCMPQQKVDIARLQNFAASHGYDAKLKRWDIPFWKKKEREELYNVQQWGFPFEQTFRILLAFTTRLFGFEYQKVSANHFVIIRNGEQIGRFVIDPYKGVNKFPGTYILRNHLFSTLILNFEPPSQNGEESMLTVSDVTDLFENFGHLLQSCLCPVEETVVPDFNVVGHFLAMWLANGQFMTNYFGLDGDKLTCYLESKNHFVATDLCHELYLADLDLELSVSEEHWLDIMRKKLWPTYSVLDMEKDRFLCSSPLIWYGSTYYTNLWSKMLAADCYRAFVESKESKDVAVDGARFRKCFFEAPANSQRSEIFRSFRGRDPSPDAFLWSMGLLQLKKIEN